MLEDLARALLDHLRVGAEVEREELRDGVGEADEHERGDERLEEEVPAPKAMACTPEYQHTRCGLKVGAVRGPV